MSFRLWVSVTKQEQLNAVNEIYPSSNIKESIRIWIPSYLYKMEEIDTTCSLYISFPLVSRLKDEEKIRKSLKCIQEDSNVSGIIIHNTEQLYIAKSMNFSKEIISGPGMYVFNNSSREVLLKDVNKYVFPLELSRHEIEDLNTDCGIMTIYGKTPMMVSANCIRKTYDNCQRGRGVSFDYITDRKNSNISVLFQCDSCYNVLYNPYPNSLHEYLKEIKKYTCDFLLSFTDEDRKLTGEIIRYFDNRFSGKNLEFPIKDFTKAYFNHGVE